MAILEFARVNGTRYELADKQAREALETKAEIDGYYEDMTVGDSEQLVSTKYVDDSAPYKYRTTGGSADVGNRAYLDKVVGGTIAWNQLSPKTTQSRTLEGITYTNNNDGSYTANGTATNNATYNVVLLPQTINNHVILFFGCPAGGSQSTYRILVNGLSNKIDFGSGTIAKPTGLVYPYLNIQVLSGATVTNLTFKPQLFDLTQMFGSAIADYIYSLEQANAGAGVAFFRSWFPDSYYEYNAGELISVEGLQKRKTVGFNLWDEETESGYWDINTGEKKAGSNWARCKNPIPVFQNTAYFFKATIPTSGSFGSVIYLDSEGKPISHTESTSNTVNRVITTPTGCAFIVFYANKAWFDNPICINLSWSGTRNGEYAPYEEHEYPLDSSLTLRGIPKLVDGEVKWDGDEYLPEGKVKRKYGIVDLGTLNWSSYSFSGNNIFIASLTNKKVGSATIFVNGLSSRYAIIGNNIAQATIPDQNLMLGGTADGIYVNDQRYSTAADYKAAMQNEHVYLVYELATPTEETADPFTEVQIVDDWGTEEFISDSIVPVGHETRYPANLRDKLQHLPDLASADGNYLIQQSGSQLNLVHFHIPQAPTEDGTYVLKATVSGGTPTYTWEAEE